MKLPTVYYKIRLSLLQSVIVQVCSNFFPPQGLITPPSPIQLSARNSLDVVYTMMVDSSISLTRICGLKSLL